MVALLILSHCWLCSYLFCHSIVVSLLQGFHCKDHPRYNHPPLCDFTPSHRHTSFFMIFFFFFFLRHNTAQRGQMHMSFITVSTRGVMGVNLVFGIGYFERMRRMRGGEVLGKKQSRIESSIVSRRSTIIEGICTR